MKTSFNRVIIGQLLLLLLIAGTAAAQDLEKVGTESPVKISGSVGARGVAYGAEGIALAYLASYAVHLSLVVVYLRREKSERQTLTDSGGVPCTSST